MLGEPPLIPIDGSQRIGQTGNRGPGPDLTHIGSELSRNGIEHAIIDPTAPMPSFKHLPPARFKAVVTFLHETWRRSWRPRAARTSN